MYLQSFPFQECVCKTEFENSKDKVAPEGLRVPRSDRMGQTICVKKNTVPVQLQRLKLVCILGSGAAFFHRICESLPGIVTSYGVNLLKPKVCNNLLLVAANFTKNIQ